MTPADYTIETLVSGICSFALLSIDKIGNGYELLFTLKEVSRFKLHGAVHDMTSME